MNKREPSYPMIIYDPRLKTCDNPSARPRVTVIGQGYIGLPTAALLAKAGYSVLGVDIREDVVNRINAGIPHIHEPNLDALLADVVNQGRLRASTKPELADIYIICVPTPFNDDKSPNLSYVQQAAESLRPLITPGAMVILESTSPPGTTEQVVIPAAIPEDLVVGRDVFVAYCPERVLPGKILAECIENDRIVGGITTNCQEKVSQFYRTFVTGAVHTSSATTAEMAKLTENTFRDINIAFANELSVIADEIGVDAFEVIRLANCHPRVNVLNPGPGVGGHCISVDPWFLVHAAPTTATLIRTAREVNDAKPHHVVRTVVEKSRQFLSESGRQPVIACLGLSYKADVDDFRESPSVTVVKELSSLLPGTIIAVDPFCNESPCREVQLIDLEIAIERSDILVLLTDHTVFQGVSASARADQILIDPRGVWSTRGDDQNPLTRAA